MCRGCLKPYPFHADELAEGGRLCPECLEEMYERLARTIDPTYDPAVMHCWSELWAVLGRLYHWPPLETTGEHAYKRDAWRTVWKRKPGMKGTEPDSWDVWRIYPDGRRERLGG